MISEWDYWNIFISVDMQSYFAFQNDRRPSQLYPKFFVLIKTSSLSLAIVIYFKSSSVQ